MARFGLSYDWRTTPFVFGLGVVPPLTYVDVSDGVLRVRFGPWFRLETRLDQIESADEARGELPAAPSIGGIRGEGWSSLQLRTARGPVVRIRFREPQEGRWLAGLPAAPRVRVDQIALNVADRAGLLEALGVRAPARR